MTNNWKLETWLYLPILIYGQLQVTLKNFLSGRLPTRNSKHFFKPTLIYKLWCVTTKSPQMLQCIKSSGRILKMCTITGSISTDVLMMSFNYSYTALISIVTQFREARLSLVGIMLQDLINYRLMFDNCYPSFETNKYKAN